MEKGVMAEGKLNLRVFFLALHRIYAGLSPAIWWRATRYTSLHTVFVFLCSKGVPLLHLFFYKNMIKSAILLT
jgi:hypothetical protein